jgi:uncharacterized protein YjbI with pentapeptide repeats
MQQTRLVRAKAKNACFDKANLENSDLNGINFFEGSMRKANLQGCRLQAANFYAVDFLGTQVEGALFDGSILDKTILSHLQG